MKSWISLWLWSFGCKYWPLSSSICYMLMNFSIFNFTWYLNIKCTSTWIVPITNDRLLFTVFFVLWNWLDTCKLWDHVWQRNHFLSAGQDRSNQIGSKLFLIPYTIINLFNNYLNILKNKCLTLIQENNVIMLLQAVGASLVKFRNVHDNAHG